MVIGIVLVAAALRIFPHPMNFTPIGALALFGGAYFSSKRAALIVPLLSLVAGDIFVGFHVLVPGNMSMRVFLISVAIGFWLREKGIRTAHRRCDSCGRDSIFLITNFGDVGRRASEVIRRECQRPRGVLHCRWITAHLEHTGG